MPSYKMVLLDDRDIGRRLREMKHRLAHKKALDDGGRSDVIGTRDSPDRELSLSCGFSIHNDARGIAILLCRIITWGGDINFMVSWMQRR